MARAQQPKYVRIGALVLTNADAQALGRALGEGLRELGYVEGQNFAFEFRSAEGEADRLPQLATELARVPVDVIVATFTPCALAAKQATTAIPIVMAAVADPVGSGLVQSLARPGGNVTGFSNMASETAGKSVELLRDMRPSLWCVLVRAWSRNRLWSFQSNSFECMRYGSASDVWIAPPPKHAVRSRAG
jgi:putative ABC transport system substrate-binding protein